MATHNKSFATVAEYNIRKARFLALDKIIEEHNAKPNQSFTLGHNHLSDLTEEEYKGMLGGRKAVEEFQNAEPAEDSSCVDTSPYCAAWAKSNQCTENAAYMIRNCKKSCN